MTLTEQQKDNLISEMYDQWSKCWKDQKFPKGEQFIYSEWKGFWNWWYSHEDYYDLPIRLVFNIWQLRQKS